MNESHQSVSNSTSPPKDPIESNPNPIQIHPALQFPTGTGHSRTVYFEIRRYSAFLVEKAGILCLLSFQNQRKEEEKWKGKEKKKQGKKKSREEDPENK